MFRLAVCLFFSMASFANAQDINEVKKALERFNGQAGCERFLMSVAQGMDTETGEIFGTDALVFTMILRGMTLALNREDFGEAFYLMCNFDRQMSMASIASTITPLFPPEPHE